MSVVSSPWSWSIAYVSGGTRNTRLDVLINNAAIMEQIHLLDDSISDDRVAYEIEGFTEASPLKRLEVQRVVECDCSLSLRVRYGVTVPAMSHGAMFERADRSRCRTST